MSSSKVARAGQATLKVAKRHIDEKPTLLFIHGMRGSHHGLLPIARFLRPDYNVLLPDIPGSGDRVELDNKTNDGYAEWLHSYIQQQKFTQKPIIIAHSMGSIIVSHFVEKYPQDCADKIIYLSPIFRTKRTVKKYHRINTLINASLKLVPKSFRYSILRSKLVSYCISHVLTSDKSQQKEIDRLHFRYSGRFASTESLLADIKISMNEQTTLTPDKKTLIILGDDDCLTPYDLALERAQAAHAKFRLIMGYGHLINYECPERIATDISNFLEND